MSDFHLAIAFDGVSFSMADGTDVTDDVRTRTPITCTLGRDQARQFSPAATGTLIAELNNIARNYSPGNTGSPYYPNVAPPKDVRLSTVAGSGGSLDLESGDSLDLEAGGSLDLENTPARVVFTGRLDNISQNPAWGDKTAGISCLGNLSKLIGKRVTSQLYQDVSIDEAIDLLLDEAGWPVGSRLLDASGINLPFFWLDKDDAFSSLNKLVNTEGAGAYYYTDGEGVLVFKNRTARLTETRSTTSQATYSTLENVHVFGYEPNYKNVIVGAKVTQVVRAIQALDVLWSYGSDSLTLTAGQEKKIEVRGSDIFINAVEPSPFGHNEIHQFTPSVTLRNGTFTIIFSTGETTSINWNDGIPDIQSAVDGILGSGNSICGGGPLASAGFYIQYIGTLKESSQPLPTVRSLLNPDTSDATVIVTDGYDGSGNYFQILTPSDTLTSGQYKLQYSVTQTSFIAFDATDATHQLRLENTSFFNSGDVAASGGPINIAAITFAFTNNQGTTGTPLIFPPPIPSIVSSTLKASRATATLNVAVSQTGGGPDYVISSGDATFSLDRTSGASATLTITAGGSGAVITGLQVRAQLVSVIRSQDVSYPVDLSDIDEGVIFAPDIREEIELTDAERLVFDAYSHYAMSRPTINLQSIMWLDGFSVDSELERQVGDRITVEDPQTGVNDPYYIEQKSYVIDGLNRVFTVIYGCEKVM